MEIMRLQPQLVLLRQGGSLFPHPGLLDIGMKQEVMVRLTHLKQLPHIVIGM